MKSSGTWAVLPAVVLTCCFWHYALAGPPPLPRPKTQPTAQPGPLDLDAVAKLLTEKVGGKWTKRDKLMNLGPALVAEVPAAKGKPDRYIVVPFRFNAHGKAAISVYVNSVAWVFDVLGSNNRRTVLVQSHPRGPNEKVNNAVISALNLRPCPVTLKAKTRVKTLKGKRGSFRILIHCPGGKGKPHQSLSLRAASGRETWPTIYPTAHLSPAQVNMIITYLTYDGFLDRAINIEKAVAQHPGYDVCTLWVYDAEANAENIYVGKLGWGLETLDRLDGLRSVLYGDAGKAMDAFLANFAEQRRLWEKRPATPRVLPAEAKELERLSGILFSKEFPEAREAAMAIGKLKSPAAVDVLIRALQDADAQTAMGIGMALGQIGDSRAIAALMSLFDREDALEVLASNPHNETLASVAHWSLMRITREKTGPAFLGEGLSWILSRSMGAIKNRDALLKVRDAWRAKLGGSATRPAPTGASSRGASTQPARQASPRVGGQEHGPSRVLESLNLTVRKDIQGLVDAVASPGARPVKLPAPSIAVRVGVATEIFGVWDAYKKLGSAQTNAGAGRAAQTLIRAKRRWCLTSGLCHQSKGVQIRCARALGAFKDIRMGSFILAIAEGNAVDIEGDEEAALHGILQHALADALNEILGTRVRLKKDQDAQGLKAGIPTWKAVLAKKQKSGYHPLVQVMCDWPAADIHDRRHSPFFQALTTLARRQKLNQGDWLPLGFIPIAHGHVRSLRVGRRELLVAVIGNTPMTHPGTSAQQIVLLDKTGKILDSLGCHINSRYGAIRAVVKDKPDPDGARIVITFAPNRWHNWHKIICRRKSYMFREDQRNQDPEWDRKGLCRIGIEGHHLAVLFPKLWPRAGGSELEFRLIAHKPEAKRGPVLENPARYVRELTARGPAVANRLIGEFQWFEAWCELPALSITAEHGGRKYVYLSNVGRDMMVPHSTGPKGRAWGLKRVYLVSRPGARAGIGFELDGDGVKALDALARDRISALAVLIDGKVLATRAIQRKRPDLGVIKARLTDAEVRRLVASLTRGMMNDPEPATQPAAKTRPSTTRRSSSQAQPAPKAAARVREVHSS